MAVTGWSSSLLAFAVLALLVVTAEDSPATRIGVLSNSSVIVGQLGVQTLLTKAQLSDAEGNVTEAIRQYDEALIHMIQIHGENHVAVANLHGLLARMKVDRAEIEPAMRHFQDSYRIYKFLESKFGYGLDFAYMLGDYAAAFFFQDNSHKKAIEAIEKWEESIEIYQSYISSFSYTMEAMDFTALAENLITLSDAYLLKGYYEKCTNAFENALNLCEYVQRIYGKDALQNTFAGEVSTKLTILKKNSAAEVEHMSTADYEELLKDKEEIDLFSTKILDSIKNSGDDYFHDPAEKGDLHYDMGAILYDSKDTEQAEYHFDQALRIYTRTLKPNDPLIGEVLRILRSIYLGQGKFEKTLRTHTKMIEVYKAAPKMETAFYAFEDFMDYYLVADQ
mmetsp:Transcript_19149/g.27248  ORF Transcript_19149/g.27248 Transcript_19149/m.27248 type:complete len:393 (+) Transcript_19149:194-1372(+)